MKHPNNIRSERVKAGLSTQELATEAGVAINTIRSWERGETEPDVSKAVKLSRLFGCTIDYLFAMTEERVA